MKLQNIVVTDAIVPSLNASNRDEAIRELLEVLVPHTELDESHTPALLERVIEREKKGSTGFGRGVAVPHVKYEEVDSLSAAIGLSQAGIDFSSLDNQPVHSIVLLISPAEKPDEHLQAMEIIFKNLSKDTFRKFLRQAESVEDVVTLLEEADMQKYA
ncbi:MAG: PTS sugar transporter subunit IIA [Planctomycetota bacterium]|jgi:mannitol/fructose-specific phosphotransferase system IIA component (Ntr-type)